MLSSFSDFSLQFHEDIYEEDEDGNILRYPSLEELAFYAAPTNRDDLENLLADLNTIIANGAYIEARKISERRAASPFIEIGKERETIHRLKQIVQILIEEDPCDFECLAKLLDD